MQFEYLTDEKRESFRQILLTELKEKNERLIKCSEEISDLRENTQDPIDAASVVEQHGTVMAEVRRLEARIVEVRNALSNFDDDFGYCVECGIEIGLPRLQFNPAATMCINCQSIEEKKKKQFAV